MRYATSHCKITEDGPNVTICGPYWDKSDENRTVVVKLADYKDYVSGVKKYVQNAFPYLSPDDREFLISGTSPEKFDELFEEADDESV